MQGTQVLSAAERIRANSLSRTIEAGGVTLQRTRSQPEQLGLGVRGGFRVTAPAEMRPRSRSDDGDSEGGTMPEDFLMRLYDQVEETPPTRGNTWPIAEQPEPSKRHPWVMEEAGGHSWKTEESLTDMTASFARSSYAIGSMFQGQDGEIAMLWRTPRDLLAFEHYAKVSPSAPVREHEYVKYFSDARISNYLPVDLTFILWF